MHKSVKTSGGWGRSPDGKAPRSEALALGVAGCCRLDPSRPSDLELPDPPPEVGAEELANLRLTSGMSQAVFGRMLDVLSAPLALRLAQHGHRFLSRSLGGRFAP